MYYEDGKVFDPEFIKNLTDKQLEELFGEFGSMILKETLDKVDGVSLTITLKASWS